MQRWKRRPDAADEMRDDAGDERRKNDGVVDLSEIQHLDAEQGSRDRGAEDRREAGQRETKWFSPDEAAELVEEPGLVALIRKLEANGLGKTKPKRVARAAA